MKIIGLPEKIEGLVFDIDQTLYDNREYYDGQKSLLVEKLAQSRSKSFDEMMKEIDEYQNQYAAENNGKKLSLGSAVGAGRHNEAVAGPVIPAEHAGPELPAGRFGFMPPGLAAP